MKQFLLWLPGILYAMTIHEFFHGYMALKFGDPTPKLSGRLTLNPLKHIDWFGFIALIIAHIGWAKPVPVNPYYFRNPKRDMGIVALAGPLSNIGSAVIIGLILRFSYPLMISNPVTRILFLMLLFTVMVNLFFAFFNLIPLHPLDGSHILESLLPPEYAMRYREMARYSPFILIGIIFVSYLIPGLNILYPIVFLPSQLIMKLILGNIPFFF